MVRHYALMYGFHTLPNMLKNLLERHVALYVYKCLTFKLTWDLDLGGSHRDPPRGFSTYSGVYGSHTLGHSVGPLVHCCLDTNFHWLWI